MEENVKDVNVERKEEEVKQDPVIAPRPLSSAERVFIYACTRDSVRGRVAEMAQEEGIERVVLLDDKVIIDYLEAHKEEGATALPPSDGRERLSLFLSNESNRLKARENATRLAKILGDFKEEEHLVKTLVKRTNLSYSQAKDMINVLSLFGYAEWTRGVSAFVLHLSEESVKENLESEVRNACLPLVNALMQWESWIINTIAEETERDGERRRMKNFLLDFLHLLEEE